MSASLEPSDLRVVLVTFVRPEKPDIFKLNLAGIEELLPRRSVAVAVLNEFVQPRFLLVVELATIKRIITLEAPKRIHERTGGSVKCIVAAIDSSCV